MIAAEKGHENVVRVLHELGGDVNQPNNNGFTPCYVAAEKGHENVVRLLHEFGGDVNQADNDGRTPYMIAAENGHENVVRVLHELGGDVNQPNNDGFTPCWIAAEKGHENVVRVLHELGGDVNQVDKYGFIPCRIAAANGHENVVRVLHELGGDVNRPDNNGRTPCWIAAENGHENVVRLLQEYGAEILRKDRGGKNALHIAASENKLNVVRLLTETMNLNPFETDNDKNTPKDLARRNGHTEVVEFLDVYEAEFEKKYGTETGLKYENYQEYLKCIREDYDNITFLVKHPNIRDELLEVAQSRQLVQFIEDHGVPHSFNSQDGDNLLHFAAKGGDVEACKFIIENELKSNPFQLNKCGEVPIISAVLNFDVDVVTFLLRSPSEITTKDEVWIALRNKVQEIINDGNISDNNRANAKQIKDLLDKKHDEMDKKERKGGKDLHEIVIELISEGKSFSKGLREHAEKYSDAFKLPKIEEKANQTFTLICEGIVEESEDIDVDIIEDIWYYEDNIWFRPDLFELKTSSGKSLAELLLENRFCMDIVRKSTTGSEHILNVLSARSKIESNEEEKNSTGSNKEDMKVEKNTVSYQISSLLTSRESYSEMENPYRHEIEELEEKNDVEMTHMSTAREEDEGEEEKKESDPPNSSQEHKQEQQEEDQEITTDHIQEKEGEDANIFYCMQLRLGEGSKYDATWLGTDKDNKGIPVNYWPGIILNIILNSPRSHPMLCSFLKESGMIAWNADRRQTEKKVKEESEKEEESSSLSVLFYNSPLFFKEKDFWVGTTCNIPTQNNVKNTEEAPKFCYGLKINPKIKTDTLFDERFVQAVVRSPELREMVDVPCIHYLFEYKWRSYGIFATAFLAILYVIFLLSATAMTLWVIDDGTHHSMFKPALLTSLIICCFQVIVEVKEVRGILSHDSSILSKIQDFIHEYVFDFWNLIDASVVIMYSLVLSISMQENQSKDGTYRDMICSVAIIVFWLKTLFFFRGIKSFSILLEVLKVIVTDMKSFLVLLVMFLGAFAGAFRCLRLDETTSFSFLRVFDMMFGDFSSHDIMRNASVSSFSLILYMIFMLVTPLVLLNAIIAVMGDSYDRAQENARTSYLASRMILLAEYENIDLHKIRVWMFDYGGKWIEASLNPHYSLKAIVDRFNNFRKGNNQTDEHEGEQKDSSETSDRTQDKKGSGVKTENNKRSGYSIPSPFLLFFYCLFLGPLWYYLLESLTGFGLKEEGDLYVFIPEENKRQIAIITGEEEGDAFSSESDWYGKLPRIMNELENSKRREEEMSQKLERLEKLEEDMAELKSMKEDMAELKSMKEDMAILKEFIMGERK
jgi:ankyrin repeat protein